MSLDTSVPWPDLSAHDSAIFFARFEENRDQSFIVVRDNGDYELSASLKRSGFQRFGNYFFRAGDTFSMAELQEIFGHLDTTDRPRQDTQLLLNDGMPDVLRRQAVSHSEADAPVSAGGMQFEALNAQQVKYQPVSAGGDPIAAIPVSLAPGTMKALSDLKERHGDIDEWLCGKLQYPSVPEMTAVLSPEQIDAVALAIDNALTTSGSICADQTGLGKGRVGAALARWAAIEDRKFIFLTEKANLFTDFIRDIVDINSLDVIGTPFLLNANSKVLDQETNEVLFRAPKDKYLKQYVETCTLPENTSLVMATYSQFNRPNSPKTAFLEAIAYGAHIHADESHNAAGEASNTNVAVDAAMSRAESFSYSSATHAKTAANMSLYKPLLPPSITALDNMTDVLDAGGAPLLEALSRMLAETGRLVRREHDLSDMEIPLKIDNARGELHAEYSDHLAPILSQISHLSMDIGTWLEKKTESEEARRNNETWYAVHWGTRFSQVIRQFLSACKVDQCVEESVAALLRDEKPTIVLQSTMEAVIREIMTDEDNPGVIAQRIHDPETGEERMPRFKDLLTLLVDRTMTARVRRGKEDPETINIDDPEFHGRAEELRTLISTFPDLPLSPIDEIIKGVEARGQELFENGEIERPWKMSEISARKLKVGHDGVETMKEIDRNVVINDFQRGDIDGLILTGAASTGLSLHSNARAKDTRVRHMIEFQIPNDPVARIQFWGRIKRRGGLNEPRFSCLATALSLELRMLAAQNKKVEELSANVSGSSDAAIKLDVPDPINALGNKIAKKVFQENRQVARKMAVSLKVEDQQADEELYFVNKLLSRLALLKTDERDAIYETFMESYLDALADLKSKGLHPTRPRELPGEWTVTDREIFDPGNPQDGPVFGAPVYVTTITREDFVYPIDRRTLEKIVADRTRATEPTGQFKEISDYLKEQRPEILKAALPKKFRSVIEALDSAENNLVKMEADRIGTILNALKVFEVGNPIVLSNDDGDPTSGVVLGLRPPRNPSDYAKTGQYFVEYVMPGDEEPRRASLATLKNDDRFTLPKMGSRAERDFSAFDNLPRGRTVLTRKILDGNPFMAAKIAVEQDIGVTTHLTLDTGEQTAAVLIPKRRERFMSGLPGTTMDVDAAFEILKEGGELHTNPSDRYAGMRIERDGANLKVTIPDKKRASAPFLNHEIQAITGEFTGNWKGKSSRIDPEQFDDLAEVLLRQGHTFSFAGHWRRTVINMAEEAKAQPDETNTMACA